MDPSCSRPRAPIADCELRKVLLPGADSFLRGGGVCVSRRREGGGRGIPGEATGDWIVRANGTRGAEYHGEPSDRLRCRCQGTAAVVFRNRGALGSKHPRACLQGLGKGRIHFALPPLCDPIRFGPKPMIAPPAQQTPPPPTPPCDLLVRRGLHHVIQRCFGTFKKAHRALTTYDPQNRKELKRVHWTALNGRVIGAVRCACASRSSPYVTSPCLPRPILM